jgi:hypothetical protein
MKKHSLIISFAVLGLISAHGQDQPPQLPGWEFNVASNFYFFKDDFFILPVLQADKNKLHLEARYNYEDRETFSGWIGYNIHGGKKLEYSFTPMIGAVTGLTKGIAPGLEYTLSYGRFELYSETEYLFDTQASENSFYYNWSDFTFSVNDWFWVGLSGQRTKLYQTKLEIQRGFLVGASYKQVELSTYLYNLGFDDPFVLVTFSVGF